MGETPKATRRTPTLAGMDTPLDPFAGDPDDPARALEALDDAAVLLTVARHG